LSQLHVVRQLVGIDACEPFERFGERHVKPKGENGGAIFDHGSGGIVLLRAA